MKIPKTKSAKACMLAGILSAGIAVVLSNGAMRRMPQSRPAMYAAER
jgi:hypothetical protein